MGRKHIGDDELTVPDSTGKYRRRATEYTCLECGKTFLSRIRSAGKNPPKYCGHACAGKSRRVAVHKPRIKRNQHLTGQQEFICDICQKPYLRQPYRNRGVLLVCSLACRAVAGRPENGFRGDQVSKSHYGKFLRRTREWACVGCGQNTAFLVQIHHIDGNRDNNPVDGSNHEIVCDTCHKLRHLIPTPDGAWRYKSSALTPRDAIPALQAQILASRAQTALVPLKED